MRTRSLHAFLALACVCFAPPAFAEPPSFTGGAARTSGPSTVVNLHGQGTIAGTAPMNVQVNAVRVGGILSPLISVLRAVLEPGVSTSVCVQVQNLLGLDLTFLGVEIDVTAFNAEAPNGVSGRIVIQNGIGGEDISPLACADAVALPQVRGEFIRELVDDTEAFAVRFVNDPFDDTPLITVQTDVPDRSYWRLAAGLAAQFKYGISGFVEYQRLESLRYFDYADVALGLRIESSFR